MATVFSLTNHPDIKNGVFGYFKGIDWMIRANAGEQAHQYMADKWKCKYTISTDEVEDLLVFECDSDLIGFMLSRPWENAY